METRYRPLKKTVYQIAKTITYYGNAEKSKFYDMWLASE